MGYNTSSRQTGSEGWFVHVSDGVRITLAKEREGGRGCSANHGWFVGWRFGDHEEEKWRRNTRTKMGYKKPHFGIVKDDNTLARETKLIGIS